MSCPLRRSLRGNCPLSFANRSVYDRDNAEYKNKRVAVIGNGASGIQITRAIAPHVKSMVVYLRSPTYISTNFLEELTPEGHQFSYSEEQQKTWREDPKAFFDYLREVELQYVGLSFSSGRFFFLFSPFASV